ncbi:MAG: Flp pilus assembly secretin CpaC [Phycisphaerales bacterium]|jgi:Flp pilus assembly secretin CpaC
MSFTANRSVRLTLVAAAAFAAGTVHSAALASTGPASSPTTSLITSDFDQVLNESARLAELGSLVHARSLLFQLRGSYGLELSDAQRDRAYSLEQRVTSKLDAMNHFDVALETARLGLATDDLLTAETKARTVANASSVDGTQRHAAAVLLDDIAARRVELAPAAPLAIDRAIEAFDSGDFITAKTEIERVVRLGVALDRTRTAQLKDYRNKVSAMELSRGSAIPAALTLMGPVQGDWLLASAKTQPATDAGDPPADPATDPLVQVKVFTAKSLMGEADQAFAERQFNTSLTKYNRVLSDFRQYLSAEEIQLAESRRAEIQVEIGRDGGPQGGVVDDVIGQQGLQRQQIEATYTNLMQQTDAAMASGDIRVARTRAAQARQTVQSGSGVLSESRYEDLITQIEAKISQINTREETLRIQEARLRSQTIEREEATARAEQMRDSDRKIMEAIDRVRALQVERKYTEALQVVDLILFLDPNNPVGLLLKDVIRDSMLVQQYYGAKDERQFRIAQGFVDNEKALIPSSDVVEFPDDWRELSNTRINGVSTGESESNRTALAAIESTSVPVEFVDNPLSDVIGFIAQNSGIDVDVDWNSLNDIGIDQDMPVSLRLVSGASISTVLDRVLAQVSDPALPAEWAVVDGILVIASDEVLRRNTAMRSYDIRDLLFEVPNFDNAPDFELQSSSGSGGGQSPFQGGGGDEEERLPRDERVTQLVQVIQNNVDPNGWLDLGGNTGAVQELSGVLIITQTPKAHRQISSLLGMLRDVRAVQINVEARFLLVSQDFFEQIGFDLDVYFTDNNQFKLNQLIDPTIDGSDYFNGDPDNVTGGGVFFVDLDGDGTLEATTITQPVFAPNTIGDQFSVVQASQNSFGLANGIASGVSGFASDMINSNPALAISGRFLDDIQVDFLVEATQADSRSVSLTAPRLTFTNGQRAWVAVTKDNAYISDLQPIVSDGSAAFDPTISIAQSGVVLDIEGVVSADRRYVTMTVITGISQLSFAPDVEVSAVAAGGGTGGGSSSTITSSIQVPVTDQSTIRTTVTVPDQGTLLLGGQRVIKEVEVETGVPVLSKIPVLSRFFSNRIDVKEESTLIILIRPQILIQDEEEERNFPGLLDQLGID